MPTAELEGCSHSRTLYTVPLPDDTLRRVAFFGLAVWACYSGVCVPVLLKKKDAQDGVCRRLRDWPEGQERPKSLGA